METLKDLGLGLTCMHSKAQGCALLSATFQLPHTILRSPFPPKYGLRDPLPDFISDDQRNPFFPGCLVLVTRLYLPSCSWRGLALRGSGRGSGGGRGLRSQDLGRRDPALICGTSSPGENKQ